MGCNCKNKKSNMPDESMLWEKVKMHAVDGAELTTADRSILYTFHDQLFNVKTAQRCTTCWEDVIKQRLVDKYIERVQNITV